MTMYQQGSVAYFTDYDHESETGAVKLVQRVVYQLASLRPHLVVSAIPLGPSFVYDDGRELFCGRRGAGPLRIALDTNVLIDYLEYGRAMWAGHSLPELAKGAHGEELEALQVILAVWVLRDVRFLVLRRSLSDAKRTLSSDRVQDRRRALFAFREAIELIASEGVDAEPHDAALVVPVSARDQLIGDLPSGADRDLVREALERNAHVFLTRDEVILGRAPTFSALGLRITSPGGLLTALSASGALHCLIHPDCAYWPFPDLGRARPLWDALSADVFSGADSPSMIGAGTPA